MLILNFGIVLNPKEYYEELSSHLIERKIYTDQKAFYQGQTMSTDLLSLQQESLVPTLADAYFESALQYD